MFYYPIQIFMKQYKSNIYCNGAIALVVLSLFIVLCLPFLFHLLRFHILVLEVVIILYIFDLVFRFLFVLVFRVFVVLFPTVDVDLLPVLF